MTAQKGFILRVLLLVIPLFILFLLSIPYVFSYMYRVTEKDEVYAPILLHHRVTLGIYPFGDVSYFPQEIAWLKFKGYRFLRVSEITGLTSRVRPIRTKYIALTFDDANKDFYTHVFPVLKEHNIVATLYLSPQVIGKYGYLNLIQLREISQSGLVEFGAHGISHIPLDNTDKAFYTNEILESRYQLERMTYQNVTSFSYPYGRYNSLLVTAIKKASYLSAVTSREDASYSRSDIYTLPRVEVNPITLLILR